MRKMHKRRLRKKDITRRKILITTSLFSLTFIFIIGYGAFSTNINLSAKGNVYKVSDKCYETSNNGDGTVTITDYDKSCGSEVNIPATIRGKTVTKIGATSFISKNIKTIIFPNTITSIENKACTSNEITDLEIPSSVTYIGPYAFRHNKIKNLTLHEGLKSIGVDAFQNNYISDINIPSSVNYLGGGTFVANSATGDNAYIYGKNDDGSIDYTHLDSYAGKNATGTQIPDTVTTLGKEAYYLVTYEEIDIPARIKNIPQYCFAQTNATKITLHEGLEIIDGYAFGYNWALKTISLPSTVTNINYNAFPSTLKTLNINKTINSITGVPWGATNATVNWTGTD